MKLLFKQRLFSWLGSYDVYAEDGTPVQYLPGEDGMYTLPAGQYYYDAACEGYSSAAQVAFTVEPPAADAAPQQVLAWLLSNERAAINRSTGVDLHDKAPDLKKVSIDDVVVQGAQGDILVAENCGEVEAFALREVE